MDLIKPTRTSGIVELLRPDAAAGDEDCSWLAPMLDEALERAQPEWEEPRRYVRASGAGTPCVRALTLGAMGHRVPVPARIARIFKTGEAIEAVNVETMRAASVLVEDSGQREATYAWPPIVGHVDCVIARPGTGEKLLVEIKSIKNSLYDELPEEHGYTPAGESPLLRTHPGYVMQFNTYAWAPTIDTERGLILFENKDNQRRKMFWLVRDAVLRDRVNTVAGEAAPYITAEPQLVAPVPADRSPHGRDAVCGKCSHRYLCKKLPAEGCDYREARATDAKVRG